jgi:isopenicillin-N N-acyltransferase-like protein
MGHEILPFISVRGTWAEMGEQAGALLAPAIARHLDAWTAHVMRETGCTREAVVAAAAPYAAPVQEHAPFLWEELEGLARGAGLSVAEVLVLQARAEVMRAQRRPAHRGEPAPECTSFAVGGRRTAGGAAYLGQNVDLVPFLAEFGVMVRQHPVGAPATLGYTTAGLLGHNGINEAGVGVCANFIDDPGPGLPRYLLSRLALRAGSAREALGAALRPPRAASRNLLLADRRGVFLDAECLRAEAAVIEGEDDLLVHANHLEAPAFQGLERPAENSIRRRERLHALLAGAPAPLAVADLRAFYRDHGGRPHSVCSHPFPGRDVQTVASVIGDLERLEVHAAKGSPCRNPYVTYTLATCREGALSVEQRERFAPPALA